MNKPPDPSTKNPFYLIENTNIGAYSPYYIVGNVDDPLQELIDRGIYSSSEIKRKQKAGAIKVGNPHLLEVWVKIGKRIYVIGETDQSEFYEGYPPPSLLAQVWWEYHYQLMPKTIQWKDLPKSAKENR